VKSCDCQTVSKKNEKTGLKTGSFEKKGAQGAQIVVLKLLGGT